MAHVRSEGFARSSSLLHLSFARTGEVRFGTKKAVDVRLGFAAPTVEPPRFFEADSRAQFPGFSRPLAPRPLENGGDFEVVAFTHRRSSLGLAPLQ